MLENLQHQYNIKRAAFYECINFDVDLMRLDSRCLTHFNRATGNIPCNNFLSLFSELLRKLSITRANIKDPFVLANQPENLNESGMIRRAHLWRTIGELVRVVPIIQLLHYIATQDCSP